MGKQGMFEWVLKCLMVFFGTNIAGMMMITLYYLLLRGMLDAVPVEAICVYGGLVLMGSIYLTCNTKV